MLFLIIKFLIIILDSREFMKIPLILLMNGRYKNFNTLLLTEDHYNLLKKTKIFNYSYEDIFAMTNEDDFLFISLFIFVFHYYSCVIIFL